MSSTDGKTSTAVKTQLDESMTCGNVSDSCRVLLDGVPNLIWIADDRGQAKFFNKRWLQFTGRTLEQGAGEGWLEQVFPEDRARRQELFLAAAANRESVKIEYRMKRADGLYRWISEEAVPLTVPGGCSSGYLGCCNDVTDAKEAELARRELADKLIKAQEAERTRIARELHDDIGQQLAILRIQMQRAGKPVSGSPGQTHAGLTELGDKVQKIAMQVSKISHKLHSTELEYLGLKVALQGACREFKEKVRVSVDFSCDELPAKIDGVVGLCFLRVVQEALHNIGKHSGASKVEVKLANDGTHLMLEIIDNGRGFDVEEARMAAGLGLISMRERMHLISGEFEIRSKAGVGTRITARGPLNPPPRPKRSI